MGVIGRKFSSASQLYICEILFPSTGVAPEGDIFSSVTLRENSKMIERFTATLSDATRDAVRAKKNVCGIFGTRNGKNYCLVTLSVECLCYNNDASINL